MARWQKRFRAWASARSPISVDEVEPLLHRVFGSRVVVHEGGSHRWTVAVPELGGHEDDFHFGHFGVPVKGGQWVKARYCQIAYEAAERLGLPDVGDDDEDDTGTVE